MINFRYPKDAEKHLLAIKSGLTRSQVSNILDQFLACTWTFFESTCSHWFSPRSALMFSHIKILIIMLNGWSSCSWLCILKVSNWFINARVRLWKPLVEEMCSELNRKKGSRQHDEESNNNNDSRSQLCVYDYNQRWRESVGD